MSTEKSEKMIVSVERAMMSLSWIITLFVTIMLVADISVRFLFGKPLPASYEISEVLMPYIVMFAFPYALTMSIHVRVTLLTDRLSRKAQLYCEILGNTLSLIMCVLLTYWSWLRFWESFLIGEEILAPVSIPWWIGKLGMPIAFGMFGLRFFLKLIECRTHPSHARG